jgi:7,8-dihydro-6-hydroxymethylpterin-pyrophosphokinase
VLQPLADVRPGLRLPGQSRTVRELLAALPTTPAVALAGEQWE